MLQKNHARPCNLHASYRGPTASDLKDFMGRGSGRRAVMYHRLQHSQSIINELYSIDSLHNVDFGIYFDDLLVWQGKNSRDHDIL